MAAMSLLFFGFSSNDCLEIDRSEMSVCGMAMGMLVCMSLYSVRRHWLLLLSLENHLGACLVFTNRSNSPIRERFNIYNSTPKALVRHPFLVTIFHNEGFCPRCDRYWL